MHFQTKKGKKAYSHLKYQKQPGLLLLPVFGNKKPLGLISGVVTRCIPSMSIEISVF